MYRTDERSTFADGEAVVETRLINFGEGSKTFLLLNVLAIGIKRIVGIPGTAVDVARTVRNAVAAVVDTNLDRTDRNFKSWASVPTNKGNRMLRSRHLLSSMICLAVSAGAYAQAPRVSPPDIAGAVIDGNRVSIFYSRPYSKDPQTGAKRKIWGGLVPYGKVWRMGANEATTMITQKPIVLGGQTIPAGAHTLFVLPAEDGSAKLIVNNQIGQWGLQYDEKQDLCRVPMTKEDLKESLDQLQMAVQRNPAGGGVIKLMWETTQYSVAVHG